MRGDERAVDDEEARGLADGDAVALAGSTGAHQEVERFAGSASVSIAEVGAFLAELRWGLAGAVDGSRPVLRGAPRLAFLLLSVLAHQWPDAGHD